MVTLSEHHLMFLGLALVVILIKKKSSGWSSLSLTSGNRDDGGFRKFQTSYVRIFLLAMLADWMQGPYVYKLYAQYGYNQEMIARLFVVGFGTAGLFGILIGGLADRFGRRRMCLAFCVCYAGACVTKHFHNYGSLMVGRFLGGVSTAILFSAFEAYMVTHHHSAQFPQSLLNDTFRIAWNWNSIVAVSAGIITSMAVSMYASMHYSSEDAAADTGSLQEPLGWGFSMTSPSELAAFDCSFVVLALCAYFLQRDFEVENYGDTSINVQQTIGKAVAAMRRDNSIVCLGIVQSCFEASMYVFVFMWTPALEGVRQNVDHGWVFANFMVCCMIGTDIFGLLTSASSMGAFYYQSSIEKVVAGVLLLSAICMLLVYALESYWLRLSLFFVFECAVGVYFPAIGSLRSKYVPDSVRTTVMNFFRIPLNVVVVLVLLYIDSFGMAVFAINVLLLLTGAFFVFKLKPPLFAAADSKSLAPKVEMDAIEEAEDFVGESLTDSDADPEKVAFLK